MGSYFSKDDGHCSNITSQFAFPCNVANQHHKKCTHIMQTFSTPHGEIKFHEIIKRSNRAMIFCHGNCMTVNADTINLLRMYADALDVTVFMLEYPGYGESADLGTPNPRSCVSALHLLVQFVRRNFEDYNIIFMGQSVGTGVVAQYLYQHNKEQFGGMILISPYKSIINVVFDNQFAEIASSSLNFYKTQDIIDDIHVPIHIVHGCDDDVINISHSVQLSKINSRVGFSPVRAGHNDILQSLECIEIVAAFVAAALQT